LTPHLPTQQPIPKSVKNKSHEILERKSLCPLDIVEAISTTTAAVLSRAENQPSHHSAWRASWFMAFNRDAAGSNGVASKELT
jgi:hypothetical protein